MKIDLKNIYLKGQKAQEKTYAESEVRKAGVFRGGNTGALVDGVPTGSCPRLMHLRTKRQWQAPPELKDYQKDDINNREIMWGKGRYNEDFNCEKMEYGLIGTGMFLLRESETPITYEGKGFTVTGSPDVVVCDHPSGQDVRPLHLIEHKAICGSSMAIKVLNNEPKLSHILQGLFYTWHLGLKEGSLIYTSSDFRRVNFREEGKVPAPDMEHADKVMHSYYEAYPSNHPSSKKGWSRRKCSLERWQELHSSLSYIKVKEKLVPSAQHGVDNLKPFSIWFNIRWNEKDEAEWKEYSKTTWESTGVTIHDIHAQFETAANMEQTDILPRRPHALDAFGRSDKWEACTFCPLKEVCDYSTKKGVTSVKEWEGLVFNYFEEKKDE